MNTIYIHQKVVTIGKRVCIEPGACIGVRGLALERYGRDRLKFRMKEYHGNVVIEDDVHIGANTCVERGLTGNTIIMEGTKIDLLCCIGHDVKVGRNVRIAPLCNILGYVEIGDNAFIGGGSNIRNRVKIGEFAYIGMGSNVVCDVPAYEMWYGNPAKKQGDITKNEKSS